MAKLILEGSVGAKGDNNPADILAVRKRFRELGYHLVAAEGEHADADLLYTIKFFQTLVSGSNKREDIAKKDGTITPGKVTHKWLAAQNAPAWVEMYGRFGTGWHSTYRESTDPMLLDVPELWAGKTQITFSGGSPYTYLNGGFCTSWLRDAIKKAGISYAAAMKDGPPIWVRDCSPKKYGSNAKGHGSHEMGRDADIRLPLIEENMNPGDKPYQELGSTQSRENKLDREALEKQIEVLAAQKTLGTLVLVLFRDDTNPDDEKKLNKKYRLSVDIEKVMEKHKNHIHVRVAVPVRIEGVIA